MANGNDKIGQQKLKSGFQKLMSNIGDAIADAASLEVATFTGDFSYKTKQVVKNDVDKARISNVLKQMTLDNSTDLKLVAYTNVKIDSDVTTIVKSDLSQDDNELLRLHKEMIESSKASRQAVISMVKDLVKIG
jgi:hypothetical protein